MAIDLFFKGEIHFGPMYFEPKLIGFNANVKINFITEGVIWSPNDEFVALAEFSANLDSMKLLLINTSDGSTQIVDQCHGLLTPLKVNNTGKVEFEWREKGIKEVRLRG